MLQVKQLLLIAGWFCIAHTLQGQPHYNAWFRGTLSIPVHEKIKIDAEFQHRRQNGFDNNNPLDKNLMFTFRNWIHYQQNENVKFSLSPFAYFSNYRVIGDKADEAAKPANEIRFSAAVDLRHKVFGRFHIINRNAIEYRIFDNNQPDITRLRNRAGIAYGITEKAELSFYDELFSNLAGLSAAHFFDHNRVGLSVAYKILPVLKLDIGYVHITRLSIISNDKQKENNVLLHFTYQLKRREKPAKIPS